MQQWTFAVIGVFLGVAIWLAPAPLAAQSTVDPAAVQQPAPITATVNTGGVRLRVRSGPGVAYPIVTRLNNNQQVAVIGADCCPIAGSTVLCAASGAGASQMATPRNTPIAANIHCCMRTSFQNVNNAAICRTMQHGTRTACGT